MVAGPRGTSLDAGAATTRPSTSPPACGARALDCEGGACVNGACGPVVLANDVEAGHIAHDESYVYVADSKAPAVIRIKKSGGPPEVLARLAQSASGLALADGLVFFSAGRSVFSVAPGTAPAERATLATGADQLAVAGDWLYILDAQAFGSVGALNRKTGAVREVSALSLSAQAITSDGKNVYWGEAAGAVSSDVAQPPQVLVKAGAARYLASLHADSEFAYFTDAVKGGRIARVSKETGTVDTVAVLDYPAGLDGVAEELFVAVLGDVTPTAKKPGSLVRVSKRTGTATVLAKELDRPLFLVADSRRVFFVDQGRRTIEKLVW